MPGPLTCYDRRPHTMRKIQGTEAPHFCVNEMIMISDNRMTDGRNSVPIARPLVRWAKNERDYDPARDCRLMAKKYRPYTWILIFMCLYCSPRLVEYMLLEIKGSAWFYAIVSWLRNLSYQDRLWRVGLWSLQERRNRADPLEWRFKLKAGLSDLRFLAEILLSYCGQQNKNAWKIIKSNKSKLDIRKYFFSERVVNRWNS